jgi:flagellar basal body-associated protein FliL
VTKKTKKTILLLLLAVIIIGACIVYYIWNKPHKDVKHASAEKVTATALYQTFSTDSVKAKGMYTDKVLEVAGEVTKVTTNQQNQQVILIKTATADASVNCTMEENATGVKPGDNISIKGICSGYIAGDADMDLPGDVFIIRGYHLK